MPKLLFLSPVFPFPMDRGQHLRIANLLAACGHSFDVTFVGPPPPAGAGDRTIVDEVCARATYVDVLAKRPSPLEALRDLGALRSIVGRDSLRFLHPYLQALRGIDLDAFDLVWAERRMMAPLCRTVAARTIVDLDDIEHLKLSQQLRLKGFGPHSAIDGYRIARAFLGEIFGQRGALASVVCSDEDRAYLARWGLSNAITVPNGIDLPSALPERVTPDKDARPRLVFVGNMAYGPNVDGVELFAAEIWPLLSARFPGVVLDVIGPGASESLVARLAGRVQFRGFVSDLPGALAEYSACLAPLRYGGGTKLKILEAMANRLPLVTTQVGAQGLGLIHDQSALIGSDAGSLARHVEELTRDPRRGAALAGAAHAIVRERFVWEDIRRRLAEWLLQRLAAGLRGSSGAESEPCWTGTKERSRDARRARGELIRTDPG